MPNNDEVNIICPYFLSATRQSISCEYQDASKAQLWFASHQTKQYYQRKYCETFDYVKCPMARTNDEALMDGD